MAGAGGAIRGGAEGTARPGRGTPGDAGRGTWGGVPQFACGTRGVRGGSMVSPVIGHTSAAASCRRPQWMHRTGPKALPSAIPRAKTTEKAGAARRMLGSGDAAHGICRNSQGGSLGRTLGKPWGQDGEGIGVRLLQILTSGGTGCLPPGGRRSSSRIQRRFPVIPLFHRAYYEDPVFFFIFQREKKRGEGKAVQGLKFGATAER